MKEARLAIKAIKEGPVRGDHMQYDHMQYYERCAARDVARLRTRPCRNMPEKRPGGVLPKYKLEDLKEVYHAGERCDDN
jgi:hypothetical protein